jgi:imidazolonepropionase-like amidohydrolase
MTQLVLEHGTVWAQADTPSLTNHSIVINEGKIIQVGPDKDIHPSPLDVVIDLGNRTVMPALIDAHAKFARYTREEELTGATETNIASTVLRGATNGRLSLDAGVTTVRDVGCGHHGLFPLRAAFASGLLPGPRLLVAGRGITTTGGHGASSGAIEVDGVDAIRQATRQQLKAGADWIKLFATGGGVGSPGEQPDEVHMALDEIRAAVEVAHARRRFVMAHATSTEGALNCINAGVDSIAHGVFLDQEVAHRMTEAGTFLVPTLGIYRRIASGEIDWIPKAAQDTCARLVDRHAESFRLALASGVTVVAGTDSGIEGWPIGKSLIDELEVMHDVGGMARNRVIMSAAADSANCLHLGNHLGTITPGKLADIMVVDKNPLEDFETLRKPWLVLKEGRSVFPSL